MRRVICILFLLTTLYLAGVYQLESLMIFFMAQIGLLLILWLYTWYIASRVEVSLALENDTVEKGETARGSVLVKNRSWLPLLRFQVRISYGNCRQQEIFAQSLEGNVSGRKEKKAGFYVASDYCGVLQIRTEQIRVWDYLALFSRKRCCGEKVNLLVMPRADMVIADLRSVIPQGNTPGDYSQPDRPGDQPPEIFQIRSYQPGDNMRDIHWKLSARMDQLMSRRYAAEKKKLVDFFLDLSSDAKEDIYRLDAFWELASAVSRELVRWEMIHRVWWRAADTGNMVSQVVERPDEMRSMIKNLLITTGSVNPKNVSKDLKEELYRIWRPGENLLRLNLNLELYRNEELVRKYTQEDCQNAARRDEV